MAATLGIFSMFFCVMLFPTLHADIVYTGSNSSSSPIANLTLNPGKLKLTWDSSLNDTEYRCSMHVGESKQTEKKVYNKTCTFSRANANPIHKGALFKVQAMYNNISYSAEARFIPQGMNGTSVENFSCVIYNISFMNCTWKAGRNAPEDTRYFLFFQYSKEEDEQECPRYIRDALGRPIACSFQNVTDIKEKVYFLVNGSSNESEIQFYDEYITLYEIEILTPPLNITVNCSEDQAGCIVRWKRPQPSHMEGNVDHCFEYQIDIRNKNAIANPKESSNRCPMVTETSCTFQNYVKKKYTLQIRAKGGLCLVSQNWGEWSEPIEFGNPEDAVLTTTVVLLLIAFGTIPVALVIFFLCKRYCSLKKMFSPVPQPKNKFHELFQISDKNIQREWMDLPPAKYEMEEITTVEEIK
ncbi:granulocyte-macrophage colony-stimulating factor receptor subunit alpha-like isoform X2 [Malaclemys terrapin pileata]|uniref:granulocyte-macrophage colony-stimulating factor receptor subunit alpha-like isoform X2 n=1 Tax=Malaclemys terrapin pileata TaxID=2991368 RepID=UPI0023A8AF8B|nr:granulocyte-macrophage colony-stimulating factor receptor subunit alpha-like isoform X2 [Malaclemys terrapin pileata]